MPDLTSRVQEGIQHPNTLQVCKCDMLLKLLACRSTSAPQHPPLVRHLAVDGRRKRFLGGAVGPHGQVAAVEQPAKHGWLAHGGATDGILCPRLRVMLRQAVDACRPRSSMRGKSTSRGWLAPRRLVVRMQLQRGCPECTDACVVRATAFQWFNLT